MAEFDDNQTAVEYGESLLASRANQQKKNKKRQKKIERAQMVLAGVNIADKFMAKNAQKKVETFAQNLTSEKAQALNDFKLASTFRTNELEKLKQDNPGLDFNNESSWNLQYDENDPTKVTQAGAVYSALQKEYSQNLRAKYGKGAEGSIADTEKEAYDNEVLDSTTRAFNSLVNKYKRYKPSLNTSAELIKSQYEDVIAEGTKQIMSAQNTSSIRKLLGKFGIADKVSEDLVNVNLGGVNLKMNASVYAQQAKRKLEIETAQKNYDERIKNVPLRTVKINTASLENALSSQNDNFETNFSDIHTEGRSFVEQMSKGTDTTPNKPSGIFGPGKNTRAKKIQSILIDGEAILSAIPTANPKVVANLSQLYDSLHATGTDNGMKEINMRFNYYLEIEANKKLNELGATAPDSRNLTLSDEQYVISLSKAITDLVTIGERKSNSLVNDPIFEVTVQSTVDFLNKTDLTDVTNQKNEMLEANKNKSKLATFDMKETTQGVLDVLSDPTNVFKPQTKDQFGKVFMNNIINANSDSERVIILNDMKKRFNPDDHPILFDFYDRALETVNYGDTFDTSKSMYDSKPYLNEDEKKKMTTYKTDTNTANLVNFHLDRLKIVDKETAINNLYDIFIPAVIEIESSGNPTAKNPNSTARGLFQFLEGSVEPALNRAEKYLGTLPWGKELRVHKDASKLTPVQQTILFVGDMLEKTGSDSLMIRVFNGDIEGMIKAYEVLHHTAPDKATEDRAREIFNQYS